MHRITRQRLCPFLFALLPLLLAACGGGDNSNDAAYLELISTSVYSEHSVVVDQAVTKSWGANGYGQLGIGTRLNHSKPVEVLGNFSAVGIGGAHSVGLDTSAGGTVWAWGHNSSGQLGNGTNLTKTSPVQVLDSDGVTPLSGVKAIAAGGKHTLAIAADDTVLAWGSNTKGQLGDGTFVTKSSPVAVLTADGVTPLSGITAIAAGGDFSLALKSDGTVWAWGSNSKGQLGNNSKDNSSTAVQVLISEEKALTGITAIAAGGSHALALMNTGKIYAWGYNEFGQLGDGKITSSRVAVAVDMTGVATAVSAGLDHSLAIIDGTIRSWGYNFYGQLGNGAVLQSDLPVVTLQTVVDQNGTPLSDIVEIIATGHHCIARDSHNNIWTWGRNTHGQLGDGTTLSRSKAKIIISH